MAREPFEPDDLEMLNLMLRHYPRVADLARLVRRVKHSTAFPITSFAALAAALGGDEATVRIGNREWPMAELGRIIPAYYFPIAAEDDLVAKLVELIGRRPGPWLRAQPGMPIPKHLFRHRRHGGWGPPPHVVVAAAPWAGGAPFWGVGGPPPSVWGAAGPPPPPWGGPPPPPPMWGGHQAGPTPMPPPPDRPE